MKHLLRVSVFIGLILLYQLYGQTKLAEKTQLGAPNSLTGLVRVLTVDGWQNALPDSSIVITKVGTNNYTIKAVSSAAVIRQQDVVLGFGGQNSISLPNTPLPNTVVAVMRNGLTLQVGLDYTVSGNVITRLVPSYWDDATDTTFARFFY